MAPPVALADPMLDRIVQRLLERTEPELILLFGSRASGEARIDSDYDILIVIRDESLCTATQSAAYDALRGLGVSVDVLVISAEQYERRQTDPGFLSYLVARTGHVLYTTGRVPQRSARAARVREERSEEGLAMWIERAESDLRAAEECLATADPVTDAICFHSHACVEKLLKALIVQSGVFPARTHNLQELLALQPADLQADVAIAGACTLLTSLFPKMRYPELPMPTLEDAREAISAAREVHQRTRPRLGT